MASKESDKIKQEEEDNLDESTEVLTLNKKQRQKIAALKKRAAAKANLARLKRKHELARHHAEA